jgi:hypothetical protein
MGHVGARRWVNCFNETHLSLPRRPIRRGILLGGFLFLHNRRIAAIGTLDLIETNFSHVGLAALPVCACGGITYTTHAY